MLRTLGYAYPVWRAGSKLVVLLSFLLEVIIQDNG